MIRNRILSALKIIAERNHGVIPAGECYTVVNAAFDTPIQEEEVQIAQIACTDGNSLWISDHQMTRALKAAFGQKQE